MSLSKPKSRKLIHQRRIHPNAYLRQDGLWDIEANLTDDKAYPFPTLQRGVLPVGELVHDIWLRLTVNNELVIQAAEAKLLTTPFVRCPAIETNVERLVGLKIESGWTQKAKEQIGSVAGCSHIVELLRPMATTAIQAIYPYLTFEQDGTFPITEGLINSCYGFAADGDVIEVLAPGKFKDKKGKT
ncbi:DUF2889 domain-containing protein [Kangiella sp. HZ709]|uniref:DUF2889 domain-containing protein n=1 Tax=Kangiella sp. HZ709 TaxID=2666328 RepID=UPI0012AEF908|nr:DUF2889 domain-containing protein [Kangiella sp. HZ709]MRX27588.1 DUF2889 domain-containing protein [Kangiella sp. HZ709]